MNNKNYRKILSIFWIIAISVVSVEGTVQSIYMRDSKIDVNNPSHSLREIHQLPAPRAFIPRSIQGRVATQKQDFRKQTKTNVECNSSITLCSSFEGNENLSDVSAWIGFEFNNNTGKYFIATYGQKAKKLGNRTYSTEKWSKRHLWLNIGKDNVPLSIQARFVDVDMESDNEWYTVDYIGYRIAESGIDYSNYPEKMSISGLLLLVNPKTKEVVEYHIEYYDENSEYVGNYQIKVGDEIESYFIGFSKKETDTVYLFYTEDIATVKSPVTFTYKEQYPGKDFDCTHCKELDLTKVEFKYMFEAYGQTRSNFTEPKPLEEKINSSNNSDSSTKKSVPFSGFWILFILTIAIAMMASKRNKHLL